MRVDQNEEIFETEDIDSDEPLSDEENSDSADESMVDITVDKK